MYKVKKIKLRHKLSNKNQIFLLLNSDSLNPLMYPFLYSLRNLSSQSIATQQADLTAIKKWYEFWFNKKSSCFCNDFYSNNMHPNTFLDELDSFYIYLENDSNLSDNLIRLGSNEKINYETQSKRIRSVIKFFHYLLDEYFNIRYQDQSTEVLLLERIQINNILKNKVLIVNNSFPSKKKNNTFKSLNQDMYLSLYKLISPANNNSNENSFKNSDTKHRNFLIVHLLLNYGLRIGELLLLTTNSIKKSVDSKRYSIIVANTIDEYDQRSRKPEIKNQDSYRVIEITERDYSFINIYIDKIRQSDNTKILFTSLRAPYSALSYSSVNKIFNKLNDELKKQYPHFFDTNNLDSIEKLTPHVCRHTWAYMTFKYSVENYQKNRPVTLGNEDIFNKAKDDLRLLGGWTTTSNMPSYYARRFISERANFLNLQRIKDYPNYE